MSVVNNSMDSTFVQPSEADIELFKACEIGDLEKMKMLVGEKDADLFYQDEKSGMSVLMTAAGAGHKEIVEYLLEEGVPWNAVDKHNLCAGDYAVRNGHQEIVDFILNHAVVAEMLLGSLYQNSERTKNLEYLASGVSYSKDGDTLVDTNELAVMMAWEKPLMAKHAEFICTGTNHPVVLNVGFGMGLVDVEIQRYTPSRHVIIEAHAKVLKKMEADGWMAKPSVDVRKGRWQEVVPQLISEGVMFDGIFFDTYAEYDFDLKEFHDFLGKLLVIGGRYSFYNGMCPDNVFFHGVACEVFRLQLRSLSISCSYEAIPVDIDKDEIWKNVRKRYWHFDKYYLPKCIKEVCV